MYSGASLGDAVLPLRHVPYAAVSLALCMVSCARVNHALPALFERDSNLALVSSVAATDERIASLQVPEGYRIRAWATGLKGPRMLDWTDDGWLLVTRPASGDVWALRDADGDGVSDLRHRAAKGLAGVHGLEVDGNRVTLVTEDAMWEAALQAGGVLGEPEARFTGFPTGGVHKYHFVGKGPDGRRYVSVGSSCNACVETHELRATMVRFDADGISASVFATGLRNTQGFDWHPTTGVMWAMDNGADHLGDTEPPEELNRIESGRDYGWPWQWASSRVDGEREPGLPAPVDAVLTYQAHTAPIDFVFHPGGGAYTDLAGDALVAMHGSWNRRPPAGFEVLRVAFDDRGEPTEITPFASGWLVEKREGRWAQFGRPAGLAIDPSGAIYVSDDSNGVIYQISRE